MSRYVIRRLFYSLFIIFGILILTFLLFHMAAGDPTAVLLGKNPTPKDVEITRDMLGCDKPLFYGHWKRTELYSSADFTAGRTNFPRISYEGAANVQDGTLTFPEKGAVIIHRNFDRPGEPVRIEIGANGPVFVNEAELLPVKDIAALELADPPETITVIPASGTGLKTIRFFRPTRHPFDSQALSAVRELVSFQKTFPYVSFFNFGNTLQTREPIRAKLFRGMIPSLCLMLPIFFGELILGIILAMISCAFRDTILDRTLVILSVAGMSTSYLALIIFGQWWLAYYLNLFPVWGWGSARYLALPVLLGIISGTGSGVRFYRTVFLDEIKREYLRTARAKGATPFRVYFIHLLKNAMVPIITRASTILPFLFTGSLLLESFFGIPGLGYEGINALNDSDLQMLKALVILGAILFIGINLITDIAYAWVDPRIRLERSK